MKIKREIEFPYGFFCFKDGVKVSEEEINEWINKNEGSSCIASGDTEVEVNEDEDGEITITVTRGRYEFDFNRKDVIKEKKK